MNSLQSSRETWNNDSFAFNGTTLQHIHQENSHVQLDTNEAIGHLYSVYECVNHIFDLIHSKNHSEKELGAHVVKDLKYMEFLIGIIKKTYTNKEMKLWEDFVSQKLKFYEAPPLSPLMPPQSPSISPPSPEQVASLEVEKIITHIPGATNRDPFYRIYNGSVQYFHSHSLKPQAVRDTNTFLKAVWACSAVGEETRERFPEAAEDNLKLHNELIEAIENRIKRQLERENKKAGKPKIRELSSKTKRQKLETENPQPPN